MIKQYIVRKVSNIPTYQVYKYVSTNDDGTLTYEWAGSKDTIRIFFTIKGAKQWIKELE